MRDKDKFYLENRKNGIDKLILYRRYVNGEPIKLSIGYSIPSELWDRVTQRPTTDKKKITEYLIEYPTIKTHLKNIETRIHNFRRESEAYLQNQILNNREFDKEDFKKYLKGTVRNSDRNKRTESKKVSPTNYSYINMFSMKFLKDITSGERQYLKKEKDKKAKVRYEYGTIKSYKNCLEAWKYFELSQGTKFKWSDFKQSLYDKLVDFLYLEGYSTNYIGKVIKCLKVIFRTAYELEITTSLEFNKKYFVILSTEAHNIALTEEEVNQLENLDLSQNETLDKARDIFLLGCYTALRISDLMKINKDHIKEGPKGKYLDIIMTKTKSSVKVPLKSKALAILEKYNFNSPKITEQTVNNCIKVIAKNCGIVEMISFIKSKNNIEEEKKCPKYELITNHTGRRTAATLMYKQGIPSLMIMGITGHKTESSFMKYIKITQQAAVEQMAEHEFFK